MVLFTLGSWLGSVSTLSVVLLLMGARQESEE